MTWSQEISQLITDVDQLTSAANVKKSELDASVASTETDKNAAAASIESAAASFASAGAKAQEAEAHKNAALAIYGTNAAQQTAVASVQASAALASGYAASASAALQQDLSGIATALHRSPNAITSMFVYDTSKDSDGGAWTEKCQNTSWYNEPIYGKWLGPQPSELYARHSRATLGNELVTNGNFDTDISGWTGAGCVLTWNNKVLRITDTDGGIGYADQAITLVVGKFYKATANIITDSITGNMIFQVGTSEGSGQMGSITFGGGAGSIELVFQATATTGRLNLRNTTSVAGEYWEIDNVSVREVTTLNTASGDYFQLTTDGKFYRLWKNLLPYSEQFDNPVWALSGGNIVGGQTNPFGGNSAFLYTVGNATQTYSIGLSGTRLITTTSSGHAQSFYVKANGASYVQIFYGSGSDPNSAYCNFDLTDGSVGSSASCTGSIALAGNGYYRISVAVNLDVLAGNYAGGIAIIPSKTSINRATYAGNGTAGIYIWGAQLELGSVATTYEAKGLEGSTSEVFRGNKRDFPRLAGIVAEAGNVNIYDLTEPGRPMWMRFAGTGSNGFGALWAGGPTITDVKAISGIIILGGGTSTLGVGYVDLMKDSCQWMASGTIRAFNGNISQRQSTTISHFSTFGSWISNSVVNAVAVIIFPDAPIDPVTGLRVPTIAVATNGGISIIKHNGTVVNSATTVLQSVTLTPEVVTGSRGYGNADHFIAFKPGSLSSGFTFNSSWGNQFDNLGSTPKTIAPNRSTYLKANSNRIGIRRLNEIMGFAGKHLSAVIAPNYNTGWLHGDIRRAYLSDVITGSAYADNLADNLASYVFPGTYAEISSAPDAGKTYEIRLTFTSAGGNFVVDFGGYSSGWVGVSVGERILRITTTTTTTLYVRGDGNTSGTFSNVSVREVIVDRSYKSQAVPINGTLTRTQLASGTSLVGYSGWSTDNYLQEPYKADLDFGTGEWSASAWVNIPATLPVLSFGTAGSEIVISGWTSSGMNTFSTTGESFTGEKTVNGGNAYALSSNNIPVIFDRIYRVTLNVSATTLGAYSVSFTSGVNSRSTTATFSGTGTKVGLIRANVAAGDFTLAVFNSVLGSITVDSATVQEVSMANIFDRASVSGPQIRIGVNGFGNLTATTFDGTTTRSVTTTSAYNTAQWLKVDVNYTTDGSLAICVNGREAAVTRGNPLLTLNNTGAPLTIGNSYATDAPFQGSIALLKLGVTVPTPEQSIFMYEQEKQLFRANAVSVLPDANAIIDMSYDDVTDRWAAISTTNESYWNGIVRTSVTPVPSGSYSKITTTSGIELAARTTINPGVDVTIPAYVLREELVKRSETANKLSRQTVIYDYIGGFTGNITTGSTAITSVTNFTYPVSPIGARISGTGIPANATITAVSGTTIYISAAATATTTGLVISFLDFELPVGFETESVTTAGVVKQEGATKDYTRLFDGFVEMIRFAVAPGATTWVRIQATKSI